MDEQSRQLLFERGYDTAKKLELIGDVTLNEFIFECKKALPSDFEISLQRNLNEINNYLSDRDKEINIWKLNQNGLEFYYKVILRRLIFRYATKFKKAININLFEWSYNNENLAFLSLASSINKMIDQVNIEEVHTHPIDYSNENYTIRLKISDCTIKFDINLYKPKKFIKEVEYLMNKLSLLNGYSFSECFRTISNRTFLLIPAEYKELFLDSDIFISQFLDDKFPYTPIHEEMDDLFINSYKFGKSSGLISCQTLEEYFDEIDKFKVEYKVEEIQNNWPQERNYFINKGTITEFRNEEYRVLHAREIFVYQAMLELARKEKNVISFNDFDNIYTLFEFIKKNLNLSINFDTSVLNAKKKITIVDILNVLNTKDLNGKVFVPIKMEGYKYAFAFVANNNALILNKNKFICENLRGESH